MKRPKFRKKNKQELEISGEDEDADDNFDEDLFFREVLEESVKNETKLEDKYFSAHIQIPPIRLVKETVLKESCENHESKINLTNVSLEPCYHRKVVKLWRKLIEDGDIVTVQYSSPRACLKCDKQLCDAIEMFRHIRDFHIPRTIVKVEIKIEPET